MAEAASRPRQATRETESATTVGEFIVALARPEAGEEGHGGSAGGLGEDGHGCSEKLLGVAHQRDGAAGAGGEVGDDPVVRSDQRDADDERQREAHPFAQALVVPVEHGPVARAGAMREDGVEQKRAEEGSGNGADGERRDAEAMHEQHSADDGAEVIDERRDGLHVELLADQEHGAKDSAGEEEKLRGQQDAGELDAEGCLLRVEAGEPPVDVPGRDDLGDQNRRAKHEVHGGEDDGEGALAIGLAAGVAIAGEDGDKGDGGRAADEEVGDHVGQHEGGIEGVGCHAAAKEPHNVLHPDKANDARQEGGDHQQHGSRESRVRVRRMQNAEKARQRGARPRLRLVRRLHRRLLRWGYACHWF